MSSRITIKSHPGAGAGGLIAIIAGVVMILAGGATWGVVATQLANERITVSQDAPFFQGALVQDPFTAFSQAEAINKHSLEMSGNRTYSEIPADDPVRADVMNASFLRSSLFTSVVSFGVALLVIGAGLVFILIGWAIRRMTLSHPIVVETDSDQPVHVENTRGKVLTPTPSVSETAESAPTTEPSGVVEQPAPLGTANFAATTPVVGSLAGAPTRAAETDDAENTDADANSAEYSATDFTAAEFNSPEIEDNVSVDTDSERGGRAAPVFEPITVPKPYASVDSSNAAEPTPAFDTPETTNLGAQSFEAKSEDSNAPEASTKAWPRPETDAIAGATDSLTASALEADRVVYNPAVHGPALSTPIVSTSSPQDAAPTPAAGESGNLPSFDELIAQDSGGPLRLSRSERLLAESKNRRDLDNERTGLTGTIPIVGASGVAATANSSAPAPSPFDPINASDNNAPSAQDHADAIASNTEPVFAPTATSPTGRDTSSAHSPVAAQQDDPQVDPQDDATTEQGQSAQEGFDYNNRAQGWQSPQDRLK